MNKTFKKLVVSIFSTLMVFSSLINVNALENEKIQKEIFNTNKYSYQKIIDSEYVSQLPENDIDITFSDGIAKGDEGSNTLYIDGLHFYNENYKINNLKLLVFQNTFDNRKSVKKIVIPGMTIESEGLNISSVKVKVASYIENGYTNETKEYVIKDLNNGITLTEEELDSDNKNINHWKVQFVPILNDGKEDSNINIDKLTLNSPIEVSYNISSMPEYGMDMYDMYVNTIEYNLNDNLVSKQILGYIFPFTSSITIDSSKKVDLEKGELVNLNLNVTNNNKELYNANLSVGFEITPDIEGLEDFSIKGNEDGGQFGDLIAPDSSVEENRVFKIPDNFTGEEITIKPYIYPAYIGNKKIVPAKEQRIYGDSIVLKMKKTSSGGNGGGVVDPPTDPNPPATSKTVILASGEKYTDVLTATVLGNEKDAPILLSQKDSLDEKTLIEIKRLNPSEIIISGGTSSVSDKVVDQLSEYEVTRIAGQDRYETASKVGEEVRALTGNKTEAILVDGTNFPDVITMSTLASQKRAPILLTEPSVFTDHTKETMQTWGINDVTIGGGEDSVSKEIENNLGVSKVSRIGGVDRFETSTLVAYEVRKTGSTTDMILVDGTNFPDGITINSLASNFKAPIMLTTPDTLSQVTADKMTEWSIKNVLIGGGYNSVSKAIEDNLNVTKKERIAGSDRYETAVKISQRLSEGNIGIGNK